LTLRAESPYSRPQLENVFKGETFGPAARGRDLPRRTTT
jgi:hypothetical protein